MKRWVVVFACACSSKTVPPPVAKDATVVMVDIDNYGDEAPVDAYEPEVPIATGPVTLALPAHPGEPIATRDGVLVVAAIARDNWRLVDLSRVTFEGNKVTIHEGEPMNVNEIANRAQPSGVVVLAPAESSFKSLREVAFALHRECWAIASMHEGKLVAQWPKTCPPVELPGHDQPVFALHITKDRTTLGHRKEKYGPTGIGAHEHARLEEMLRRVRAEHAYTKMATLAYAIDDDVDVATILNVVAVARAVGFVEARWVPGEWLPLKFPYGPGADPPPLPPPPPPPPRIVTVTVETKVQGKRTSEEVERVVKARSGIFRACYQKELARAPQLTGGTLTVRFTITTDGQATDVTANKQRLPDATVECIKSNVARFRFPPFATKSTARVEMKFTSP